MEYSKAVEHRYNINNLHLDAGERAALKRRYPATVKAGSTSTNTRMPGLSRFYSTARPPWASTNFTRNPAAHGSSPARTNQRAISSGSTTKTRRSITRFLA